ncbi:cellulase family glycosylhydrolase [Sphingomonas sp. RB1R13]|uniref:cellulase family glycosylhydrolase n=1 Tax=Sphingomonas sp. RB1R13 TaxID=3096159 RepID=UPI002FC8DCBE
MIGINLSGAEFGSGTNYGSDYHYPGLDELSYYAARGVTSIRLPFTWERMQPALGGDLSSSELGYMKTLISNAQSLGISVIVDLHNYGRYGGNTIGSSAVSYQQFADFWGKLASALKGLPGLAGYDIMNEPHDMSSTTAWPTAAQAAVDAIRKVDMTTTVYVEGDNWSGASTWQQYNAGLNVYDPAHKLIYEAHQYFDRNNSGVYSGGYDSEGAYANMGADRLQPFADWLKAHNAQGFIGEFGVPSNDARWLTVLDGFVKAMNANGISGTAWGGGFWWNPDYVMRLGGGGTADSAEFTYLQTLAHNVTASPSAPTTPPPPPPPVIVAAPDPTIFGTANADLMWGTSGADKVDAAGGNDTVMGSGGTDILNGGTGTDTMSYATSGAAVDVDLQRASQFNGDAQGDQLSNFENVTGSAYADTLHGDAGVNILIGNAGDDVLIGGGSGDTIDGGSGYDTASYADSSAAVNVDMSRLIQIGGDAQGDSLINIERIVGSNFSDIISGNAGVNALVGGAGDDVLNGRGGADILTGGPGNDRFVFDSPANANGDRVTDFTIGDRLDLSLIDANSRFPGDQAFKLIGAQAFTGAAGQLRVYVANNTTYVAGDVNGDRIADFTITLDGNHPASSLGLIL